MGMKTWGLGILILVSLSSCSRYLISPYTPSDINTVPNTFEPLDRPPVRTSNPLPEEENPGTSNPNPTNPSVDIPVVQTQLQASKIITIAQRVIETEAQKLGTACNRFVLRVLSLAGFANVGFLANSFDQYAKKYLKNFSAVEFKADKAGQQKVELQKYIWSYPERTAFVFQWKRSSGHGHIALIERISDKLVIYQASLSTQIPHKDQTKIEYLLNTGGRSNLIVYTAAR